LPVQSVPEPDGRLIAWVAGACIFLLLLGGFGAIWWNHREHQLPPPEKISAAEKHRETRDAFVEAVSGTHDSKASDSETAAITAALDSLNTALRAHDSVALAAVFDSDTLCDSLEQQGAFKGMSSGELLGFRSGFDQGASSALLSSARRFSWDSHKLKKLVLDSDRRDAVVYDLETHGTPPRRYSTKVRWWLHFRGGRWRIWDFEMLEQGFRMSTIMASGMGANGPVQNSPLLAVAPILKALGPDLQTQNWNKMEADLRQFDAISVPAQLDALRKTFWGVLHTRQAKYAEALADCDAIEATGQDVPIVYKLRAEACNHLGQYDKAVESCGKWEDALGSDADLYYERGTALAHLKRSDEAARAFEQSMDEDPDAGGSLAELSKVLPEDGKFEIARRFALSQAPTVVFIHAIPILQRARDLTGMQQLIDAYALRPESAGDQWLSYYRAELFILRKQYKDGEALLQPLVPSASTKGKALFASEYYFAATMAGDAVTAYQSSAQPTTAYHELANPHFS
jgi:tetratricopeptide (TPR) repeat protein